MNDRDQPQPRHHGTLTSSNGRKPGPFKVINGEDMTANRASAGSHALPRHRLSRKRTPTRPYLERFKTLLSREMGPTSTELSKGSAVCTITARVTKIGSIQKRSARLRSVPESCFSEMREADTSLLFLSRLCSCIVPAANAVC